MTSPEFRRILRIVSAFAREHQLLGPGPLVVAVSGGTDSVALLALLAELAPATGATLHVAHFDHRMRPRSAARDTAFVADLAARFGATVRVGRADHAPASEDDARNARYAFLRRVATELGASAIATGHTRDDQAETVLLHLVRGAGLGGIASMRPSRDGIVRPLLPLARADTVAVCAELGVTPREDPSNRSLRYARNRMRHRVLPELARINPQVTEALARLASAAAIAADSLERRADTLLAGAMDGDAIVLDHLDAADGETREEVLARAWQRATGRKLTSRGRRALSREAARRDGSATLDLPGGSAVREYSRLRLRGGRRDSSATRDRQNGSDVLALEPERPATWRGWSFVLTERTPADSRYPLLLRLPLGPVTGLTVRSRRPGDRMAGVLRNKVQDVFTDLKVPAGRRGEHPLLVSANGSVLWIPGVTDASIGPEHVATPPEGSADRPEAEGRGWTVAARPPHAADGAETEHSLVRPRSTVSINRRSPKGRRQS